MKNSVSMHPAIRHSVNKVWRSEQSHRRTIRFVI